MDPLLDQLSRGRWAEPDTGRPPDVTLPAMVIERSLGGLEAELVRPFGFGRRIAVVSDPTTRAVLGQRVERALGGLADVRPIILPDRPHADKGTATALCRDTATDDALVAVGSGTINDLCKYAAAKAGKPYVVFATAPSMNGYASMSAAITVDGHKKSLAAVAPLGVFMDLEVLAAAPARMIRAGLGDSLCRPTAQADWLLSHRLHGTPYRASPFALLAEDEPVLLDHADALAAGNVEAMRHLARTLLLSGIGMTICHGSYPASQGEHLISHFIDMFAPTDRASFFHGEQVGVATLTMARIQERLLSGPVPAPTPTRMDRQALCAALGDAIGESCWREFAPKRLDGARAAGLRRLLAESWPEVGAEITRVIVPAERLDRALARADAPRSAAEIGLEPAFYARAVAHARYLRDRYTFLDLADDSAGLATLAAA